MTSDGSHRRRRRAWWRSIVVLLTLAAPAAFGCRAVLGIDDLPSERGPADVSVTGGDVSADGDRSDASSAGPDAAADHDAGTDAADHGNDAAADHEAGTDAADHDSEAGPDSPTRASLTIAPPSFTYPTVGLFDAGAASSETFVVTNGGDIASAALSAGVAPGTGTAIGDFVIGADGCSGKPLAPMSSCSVAVAFRPTTLGGKNATLQMNGGAPSAALSGVAANLTPLTVDFHGIGTQTASIVSSPGAISCAGNPCVVTAGFAAGSSVVLTVTQAAGAIVAWSNGCTGTSCTVALNGPTTVHVTSTNQNVVFLTSQAHSTANYGGLGGANGFCNSVAAAGGVPGRFAAFLGTSTTTPYAALGSARGWIRPDGMPFTDTVAAFQNSGVMWYPAVVTELGSTPGVLYFTGGKPQMTCADWTSSDGESVGIAGQGGEGAYFTGLAGLGCNSSVGLACFGTDFTTPVAVSPVAGRHAFATHGLLPGNAGIAAADALCQSEATAARLDNPTHFLAAMATTTTSAASRFDLSGAPWVRTDGVLVAATPADFMAGKLVAPPAPDATGAVTAFDIWLGSSGGMTAPAANAGENCSDWSSGSPTSAAVIMISIYGGPDVANAYAVSVGVGLACNTASSVLCLEN